MPQPPPPSYFQSLVASAVLLSMSILFFPVTLAITLTALLWTHLIGTSLRFRSLSGNNRKIVLVTGARSNKALTLMRAFKRAGHRVIAAEEEEWGKLACARFSRAVDHYYILPNALPDDEETENSAYVDAIMAVVAQERVDAWVPCSSVQATMQDCEAALRIRAQSLGGPHGCDTFIQHPKIAASLHWKDRFMELLVELGYPVPRGQLVTSISQALDFLYAPENVSHAYILKCLTLDDLARDDFTLLPLASPEETLSHLKKMPTSMNHKTPFLLQRFLEGPEYCCHVAARKGQVSAFVACRSNEMLMRYVDVNSLGAKEMKMGGMIERWVKEFLARWKDKLHAESNSRSYERELTGHFSFDFIWQEDEHVLYALECNVRAHTAVCLFSTTTPFLAQSYLMTSSPPLCRPPPQAGSVSWITHAFPIAALQSFLQLPIVRLTPPAIWGSIHPGLETLAIKTRQAGSTDDPTASPQGSDTPFTVLAKFGIGTFLSEYVVNVYRGAVTHGQHMHVEENMVHGTGEGFGRGERDPYWEWTDPLPFFVLVHFTWAWLWLRLVLGRCRKWRRVNVSTERIFEC